MIANPDDIEWVDDIKTDDNHWSLQLSSLKVLGGTVDIDQEAVMNTLVDSILLPSDLLTKLESDVKEATPGCSGSPLVCPCTSLEELGSLVLSVGNMDIELFGKDYASITGSSCTLKLASSTDYGVPVVLGIPVYRNYILHDQESNKIGFFGYGGRDVSVSKSKLLIYLFYFVALPLIVLIGVALIIAFIALFVIGCVANYRSKARSRTVPKSKQYDPTTETSTVIHATQASVDLGKI